MFLHAQSRINLVYMQNIDENRCSPRYVNGNTSNTLVGTYGNDSLILDPTFGRVRASNASRTVESFTNGVWRSSSL